MKIRNTFVSIITGMLLSCSTMDNDCSNAIVDDNIKDMAEHNSIFYDKNYTGTVVDYYNPKNSYNKNKRFVKSIVTYENGQITMYESFYEDGDKKMVKPIQCNSTHGTLIYYMDNNTIGYEMAYQYGRKHGVGKSYYENGYVEKVVRYVDDRKDGSQYDFSEKGDTLKVEVYNRGVKIK